MPQHQEAGRRGRRRERIFYLAMGVAILATVCVGFSQSFFLRNLGESLPPHLRAHGFVFTAWFLLFIVQAGLVAARRTDVHRRLGVAGALLAVAMLGLGLYTALRSVAGASAATRAPELVFLAVPLFDMPVFATLVGGALLRRRDPQTHKRLMLIASIALLSPATGRMPWPPALQGMVSGFVMPDLFLLPLLLWDLWTRGRPHGATLFGGLLLIASQVLRMALSGTDTWMRFAEWAAQLST